ncbi:MAG TPA: protein phosphatase 2C domain-containing protein [Opitutaceae bacterium]|nr:protein phosphatase 2C domain-containing protein [Opitutaceae bacterium]
MPSLRAAALTDIGRVRRENEDRLICDPKLLLFGVADGVGGLPGGAEAAELAINEVTAAFRALSPGTDPDLPEIAERANVAVGRLGLKLSPAMGIGTTLTVGCIRGSTLRIAHVGDSRCYAIHAGELTCLTEDHSVENEAKSRRARGEIVYYHEANRHALTRCIGQPSRVEVDVITRPLASGDRYLFCTDGVTRLIADAEIGALMEKHDDPTAGLREIIATAVTRGGPDNATGVMVYIDRP